MPRATTSPFLAMTAPNARPPFSRVSRAGSTIAGGPYFLRYMSQQGESAISWRPSSACEN